MLSKVIKYESRSLWKKCAPLVAIMAIAALIACGMEMLLDSSFMLRDGMELVSVSLALFYFFLIFSLFAVGVIIGILILLRFYHTCFSDEGYLTFMLPVKRSTLLLGKALTAYLYCIGYVLLLAGTLYFIDMFPTWIGFSDGPIDDLLDLLLIFSDISLGYEISETAAILFLASEFLLELAAVIMLAFFAVIVGSTLMKKQKLFGSILFGAVIFVVEKGIEQVFAIFTADLLLDSILEGDMLFFRISGIFSAVLYLALTVGAYFASRAILGKHLNLE